MRRGLGNHVHEGAQKGPHMPTPRPAPTFHPAPDLDTALYDTNTGFGLYGTKAWGAQYGQGSRPPQKIDHVRPLCMNFFKNGVCNRRGPHNQGCLFRHDETQASGKINTVKPEAAAEVRRFREDAMGLTPEPLKILTQEEIARQVTEWCEAKRAQMEEIQNAAPPAPLPQGWGEAQAPNGQTYFYNLVTKATQWTRPSACAEGWSANAAGPSACEAGQSANSVGPSVNAVGLSPSLTEASQLPAPWKEAKAPDGRSYYFVPGANHTTWVRPTKDTPLPSEVGKGGGGAMIS